MSSAFDLSGRVAVVTGAASGIGAATLQVLAESGATVVGIDVDEAGLDSAVAAVARYGGTASARSVDVTDEAAVTDAAGQVLTDHGTLDIWVNAAGIIDTVDVVAMTPDRFDRVFDVNFRGSLYGAQAAVRAMTEAGQGSIVNVVSAAIDQPARGLAAYAVSKAALTQLTRTVAHEVGPLGIRVNAVAPGFVETAMTARHYTAPDGSVDEQRRAAVVEPMRRRTPLRSIGRPEDIAYGILYLASDAARFVTGETLRINGGAVMA